MLCPTSADASCSGGGGGGDCGGATGIRRQPGRRYRGPAVGRPLFAQLVQVGQRAHRRRTSVAAATHERRVRRERRRRVTSRRPVREIPERMRPVDTRVRRANVSPQTRWRRRPGPMMRARRRSRTAPASRRTFNGRSIQPWTPRDLLRRRRRKPANNDCRSSRRCRLPRTSTRGQPHTGFRATPVALSRPCTRHYALTSYDVLLLPTYKWHCIKILPIEFKYNRVSFVSVRNHTLV